jgi:phage FluMu protein Com
MASLRVECLRCGEIRVLHPESHHHVDAGECPRCKYVGWAPSAEMSEVTRRALRERPLERRRPLRAA